MIIARRRKRSIFNARAIARRIPQRTCITCRRVREKREMLRIVRIPGGHIEIDFSGKKEGRGAYLCREQTCWEKALKGRQLEHALKGNITPGDLERVLKDGKDFLKELTSG